MRAFLATVLSIIATGVMLIAYGLLNPRVPTGYAPYTADGSAYQGARPVLANQRVDLPDDMVVYRPNGTSAGQYVTYRAPQPVVQPVAARRVVTRTATSRVEQSPRRDWVKTAMMIGGSTAAGAGVGGIFGGKKGALIGAALGGGAGTLYEVTKR
jgi:hypothetical protein